MRFNTYTIKEPGAASEKDTKKYQWKQMLKIREVRERLMPYYLMSVDEGKISTHLIQALNCADYLMGINKEKPELSRDAVNLITSYLPLELLAEETRDATRSEIKNYLKKQNADMLRARFRKTYLGMTR
jgi:hypothetical protein